MRVKAGIKNKLRLFLPIGMRKRAAAWVGKQPWLPDHLATGLIRDLKDSDPKAFHKFLWAHHIGTYAKWYDSAELFDEVKMNGSVQIRDEFFDALDTTIKHLGLDPARDIRSVLEVGCSLGYLLRYLELERFPEAEKLVGLDIDSAAIKKGSDYLANVGSNIRLVQGDMEELDRLIGGQAFDFTFASGVLSYLNADDAAKVISGMLGRTKRIVALLGLACPATNNNELLQSQVSDSHDNQWFHNFKTLIEAGGGQVVFSRWEEPKQGGIQGIYFVFAVPGENP